MIVSVIHDKQIVYPDSSEFFSPSEHYPEYPFTHFASRPNLVYKAVRDCFLRAGLDKANYDTPSWNPLGYAVPKGGSVFVLCNFVYHRRPRETIDDFNAKTTHGSVLRSLIDYVLIAVGEEGRVCFGNAPVQSCNWNAVLKDTCAAKVLEFYQKKSAPVGAEDLRQFVDERSIFGNSTGHDFPNERKNVNIDLGSDSLLNQLYIKGNKPKFRVSDYNPRLTEKYHALNSHCYLISKEILDADVVVSLPKLKTHEKVGITCGIKGMVGSVGSKDCLAHHRFGGPTEKGDEYPQDSFYKYAVSLFHDWVYSRNYSKSIMAILQIVDKNLRRLLKITGTITNGSWSGNDTAWRMALDIARIVKYADALGVLRNTSQRTLLSFIDGITAGEGNGPLAPKGKPYGYVSYADDIAAGDYVAACFMGLNSRMFPIITNAFSLTTYPLTTARAVDVQAIVNGVLHDHAKLSSLDILPFKVPAGWKEY
jgi:hypothetical protein